MMIFLTNNNYLKSNSITKTKISISAEAKRLSQKLLLSEAAEERQKLSEALLDELCDAAGLSIIQLKILDANQYHRRAAGRIVMKRYGSYRPSQQAIVIHNRTAARGQILAAKSFLDTLLHEWLHHYDTYRLGLRSIHSKGFYLRLTDLKEKLLN